MSFYGINRLRNMVAPSDLSAGLPDGRIVRPVPEPYHTMGVERLRAAWWVLTGRAHAVVWPKAGELEEALK
jgi:hypothetical protein